MPPLQSNAVRRLTIGIDEKVPVLGGNTRRYINFDNAASTPTLKPIVEKVDEFLKWYSNVHRGTGFKSKLSSWAFETSRQRIAEFVNGNQKERFVLFAKNATEAINHLAHRFPFGKNSVVLTTVMEHHSNELPWRRAAHVVHIGVLPDGRVDENDFHQKLQQYKDRIQLVAVTGASNVTGYINPIHSYARWSHEIGSKFFCDAAQLAPHRPIDMKSPGDPECIDYLAFSAHKMYAPYGLGVLIAERTPFEQGDPDIVGGGTVDIVNLENAYWTDLPDKEEAGTPDIVGAVALATAINLLHDIGWESIIDHESELTRYALEKLSAIPGVVIYGDADPGRSRERLGVISLNIVNVPHALTAAILNYESAIGTRNGCFCAHPYVKAIMHVNEHDAKKMEAEILRRDRTHLPGTVRISFGMYNTTDEIDILCDALRAIATGKYQDGYHLNKERGEYYRDDIDERFDHYFSL
jgi:cysteine desulfurase / selenocysteine lyase